MGGITSGRIKKKVGEGICLQSCRFRGGFSIDLRGYSQKSSNEKEYTKLHLAV
jgi:hypothetical protein